MRRRNASKTKSLKHGLDLPKISYNRSLYNKLIGEIVSLEMECYCEDLPDLADLGYTPEFMAKILAHLVLRERSVV